jgi:hypothetical protein
MNDNKELNEMMKRIEEDSFKGPFMQYYPKVSGTKVEFTNINLFNDALDKYYGTHNNHSVGTNVFHRVPDGTMVCGVWDRDTKSGYVIIPLE